MSKNTKKRRNKHEENTKFYLKNVEINRPLCYNIFEVNNMTLKELRIQKGLSQKECAEYLGMTTRNYQNYENDSSKTNTARYNAIYQKVENYLANNITPAISASSSFNTNVVTGEPLRSFYKTVAKFKKRDCFEQLDRKSVV